MPNSDQILIKPNTLTKVQIQVTTEGIVVQNQEQNFPDPNPPLGQSSGINLRIKINGENAVRGRLRLIKPNDRYQGPKTENSEEPYLINADGTVNEVNAVSGDYVVIEAYDSTGNVFSKTIRLTTGLPQFDDDILIVEPIWKSNSLPSRIEVNWGMDINGNDFVPADFPANVTDQQAYLRNKLFGNPTNFLTIGQRGIIHLWFEPPLMHTPGVTTLTIVDQGPNEQYNVTLGNTAPNSTLVLNQIYSQDINPAGTSGRFEVQGQVGQPAQSLNYARITCLDSGPDDTQNFPGLDIQDIAVPDQQVDSVYILLDMSGSMFRPERTGDGETVAQADDAVNNPAPVFQQLYQYACREINDHLLPTSNSNDPSLLPIYFRMFHLNQTTRQVNVFEPRIFDADTNNLWPTFPPPGSVMRARVQTMLMQALSNRSGHHTPLRSAVDNIMASIPGNFHKPLVVVISDGIGSIRYKKLVDGQVPIDVNETLKDIVLPNGRSGAFEVIGFRIPWGGTSRPERVDFMTYEGTDNWRVNLYDARNSETELRSILRGIRLKYNLDRVGPNLNPKPEINWFRTNMNNLGTSGNIIQDLNSKWNGNNYYGALNDGNNVSNIA
ncbi:hypothetical protein [Ekhidna sp.]|uniref:hypothetical protein n=1 Tax=Ekhidna sp. TaxID=2608089 RepID=UPI003BAB2F1F